ncbi:MAG: hypothetical protein FJ083_16625 [Cyanobacteria bacterium K_Offshore_surface_m2_239]|nr:hypothetical protein [Cyanobacteria bacterium K_Offshore_surface_m2_239]
MPYSYVQRPLGGSAPQTVPFPYLARDHVKLFRNYNLTTGVFDQLLVQGVHYSWINDFSINVSGALSGVLTILRATPTDQRMVDWANGSNLTAEPMDTADLQLFFAFQELYDRGVIAGIAAANALATTTYALAVDNVAAIPATPETGLRLEVANSAEIENFNVEGMPDGFVGSPALRVRIRRTATAWVWEDYRPADPDARYVRRIDITSSLQSNEDGKVLSAAGAFQLRRLIYTPVQNKAGLPAEPPDGARFILLDSTGIQSPTPPIGMPQGFVGEPGLRVQVVRNGLTWVWDGYQANDPDARYHLRRGQASVSATVVAGATWTGAVNLPRSCQLISISTDKPAWVRIYSTTEAANADATRPRGQHPSLGAGVIADPIISGHLSLEPSPCAINRESPPSNVYPLRVTNDGATGPLVVTISFLSLEP